MIRKCLDCQKLKKKFECKYVQNMDKHLACANHKHFIAIKYRIKSKKNDNNRKRRK